MFEYGDDEDYVRQQASKFKGRGVQGARGMGRSEEAMDSNRTLLSGYLLEEFAGMETPSERLKHQPVSSSSSQL